MKVQVFGSLFVLVTANAFSQGTIQFNNRLTGTSTSAVVAPVYDVNPDNPEERTIDPVNFHFYGAPLVGSGFTASLWARRSGTTQPFVQAATTPFRAAGSTATAGFWVIPSTAAVLSNVPSDPAVRADILIRVWDNQGGTITSWDQLYDPVTGAPNLANRLVHRGESLMFTQIDQLGGGTVLPPSLRGLQSFQLYVEAPEPSAVVLGVLAVSFALVCRKRTRNNS